VKQHVGFKPGTCN